VDFDHIIAMFVGNREREKSIVSLVFGSYLGINRFHPAVLVLFVGFFFAVPARNPQQ
jgi:hypothetical protein